MEFESRFVDFNKVAQKLSCQTQAQLRKMIFDLPNNEKLFSYSAHYEGVDKIVLWNSDDKQMQLRLHIYSDQLSNKNANNQIDIGKAHNHRWNFSSRILSGGYQHTLYRIDLLSEEKYIINPIMISDESVGSYYTLHHS